MLLGYVNVAGACSRWSSMASDAALAWQCLTGVWG